MRRRTRFAAVRGTGLTALGFAFVAMMCAATLPAPGFAETRWRMDSDPGSYIGAGQSFDLLPADGTFTLESNAFFGAWAQFQSKTQSWQLTLSGPSLAPLAPGLYENAQRLPFLDPSLPAFDLAGNGRGCNSSRSSFRVKHVLYGAGDAIDELWLTFDHHCEGGPHAVRGDLRWNHDPVVVAEAPWNVTTLAGQAIAFAVRGTTAGAVTLEAIDLPAGASFADSANGGGAFAWQPSWNQVGRYRVTFVARTAGGAADTASTTITVQGSSLLRLESEPGDYVLEGASRDFSPATGSFGASFQGASQHQITLAYQGASFGEFWRIEVAVPEGPIQAGTYDIGLESHPFIFDDDGGFYVMGPAGRGGSGQGRIHIAQLERAPDGTVASCRARFEFHHHGNTPALSGEFRFNAEVPVEVEAPFRRVAGAGDLIEIPVSATSAPGAPLELFALELPKGASFPSTGPASATLTWTPTVDQEGVHVLRFAAHDDLGNRDTAWTVVHVRGARMLRIDSPPGEWIGGGEQRLYDDTNARYFARPANFQDGIRVEVQSLLGQPTFTLEFYPPEGDTLRPGHYPNATNEFPRPPGTPRLEVGSSGRGCSRNTGGFIVRELEYGPFGIERFRATFEQRCDAGPTLYGEVRVDARAYVTLNAPFTRRGRHGEPLVVEMTAVDRRGGPPAIATVAVPPGGLFAGENGAASFAWTPPLGTIGRFPAVFAATGVGGAIDTATVVLLIEGDRAFRYASPPGDPIGAGESQSYGPDDGAYAATSSKVFGISGSFRPAGASSPWRVTVDVPGDLTPGFYTGAVEYGTEGPLLRIESPVSGNPCASSPGRFEVKQLVVEPNGDVRSLWLRFAKRCATSRSTFAADLRIDADVRVYTEAPAAVTGEIGAPLAVEVQGFDRGGNPAELWVSGLPDGATFESYPKGGGRIAWSPVAEQIGTYVAVLHAREPGGAEDSTMIEIQVVGRSRFTFASEGLGDPVGIGESAAFGYADGEFYPYTLFGNVSLAFLEAGASLVRRVEVAPPAGAGDLVPGIYPVKSFSDATHARLQVYFFDRSCSGIEGAIRVRSVRATGETLDELDLDWQQRCEYGTQGLSGTALYRSPRTFRVDAPILTTIEAGDTLRWRVSCEGGEAPCDFAVLDPPPGSALDIVAPDSADFVWTPGTDALGVHDLSFVAQAAGGVSDTAASRVRVLGQTLLVLNSPPGDPAGGGDSLEIRFKNARWQFTSDFDGAIYGNVAPSDGGPSWVLFFGPRHLEELVVGEYVDAVHPAYRYSEPFRPLMLVQRVGSTNACLGLTGSFRVRHLQWGPDGVESLWITFEQRCEPDSAPLTGEIRYNLDRAVPALVTAIETAATERGVRVLWQLGGAATEVAIERRHGDEPWIEIARTSPDGAGRVTFEDSNVEAGDRYGYRLVVNGAHAGETWIEVPRRAEFAFDGARPNPTTAGVVASFALPRPGPVRLELLDVGGRRVAARDEPSLAAGRHTVPLAAAGTLRPGVYVMRLTWEGRAWQKRVSVVR